jgi:capsular polysaccharide biosynthesis protein
MLEDAYRTFLEKREALDVNAAVTDVAIINNTATGAEIAYPKPVPTILIGMAAALIVGLSFGCIAEYLDQAIHRPTEVHRYLNLPVICSIEEVK